MIIETTKVTIIMNQTLTNLERRLEERFAQHMASWATRRDQERAERCARLGILEFV